jgi:hypothetical protein
MGSSSLISPRPSICTVTGNLDNHETFRMARSCLGNNQNEAILAIIRPTRLN